MCSHWRSEKASREGKRKSITNVKWGRKHSAVREVPAVRIKARKVRERSGPEVTNAPVTERSPDLRPGKGRDEESWGPMTRRTLVAKTTGTGANT